MGFNLPFKEFFGIFFMENGNGCYFVETFGSGEDLPVQTRIKVLGALITGGLHVRLTYAYYPWNR